MTTTLPAFSFAAGLFVLLSVLTFLFIVPRIHRRWLMSRAKHRSLAGHVRIARLIARHIPRYEFDDERFLVADGADGIIAARRQAGLDSLAVRLNRSRPRSAEAMGKLRNAVADVEFIRHYRVPFQFNRVIREKITAGVMVTATHGHRITDLDGNQLLDVSGSYGVNLFGHEFYKACLAEASETVADLGPVLGPYHPVIIEVVERLRKVSGHEQFSFHMSGTEAIMQAVRLARYHTGRSHVVRLCGAYHGWWDDVQPGIGNPGRVGNVYTLADVSQATLKAIRARKNIACVLVNPLQALHPNANAPGDGALVAANRAAGFDRQAYSDWLRQLRELCDERGIVLIFDEVFVGFRLAPGGAQQYFDVKADLLTYGKTLGGGLPVGVVCGPTRLMQRFRRERPLDICFARGTFNAHPMVLAAMSAFLRRLESSDIQAIYTTLDQTWERRAERMNETLSANGLPISVRNLSSIFTMLYDSPSRYNWMFQFYLQAEGLLLPWVGTGRLIFSLDYDDQEFDEVTERIIRAGRQMAEDGWWWHPEGATNRHIGRTILRESLRAKFQRRLA